MRESSRCRRLLRTHREHLFQRLHEANLPRDARRFFDECSEQAETLGFSFVGNYRMKEEPADYFGRVMVGDDGRTVFGAISLEGATPFSFVTLFADGRALETSSCEPAGFAAEPTEHDRLRSLFTPDATVREAFHEHRAAVARFAEQFEIESLAFAPEQAEDVLRYEGRLFSELLHEAGEIDDPPPRPELPKPVKPRVGRSGEDG